MYQVMDKSKFIVGFNGMLIFQDPITERDYPFMWVTSRQEGIILSRNLNAAYRRVLKKEEF